MSRPQQRPDGRDDGERDDSVFESRTTRVVLELSPGGHCFMDDLEGAIVDVHTEYTDGICRCDVTVQEDGQHGACEDGHCEVVHVTAPVCDNCPGVVFSRYGCIPRILSRTDDSFVIATYVPSVTVLSDLVNELRDICSRVEVRSLLNEDAVEQPGQTCEVDFTHLTAKQREALEIAVESGYYGVPQTTSLTELAAAFDISASALSKRLSRAEAAVLDQVFPDGSPANQNRR